MGGGFSGVYSICLQLTVLCVKTANTVNITVNNVAQARIKLSQEIIAEIQERLESGEIAASIARDLGLSRAVVSKYNKKKIDKINIAAEGVAAAATMLDSLPAHNHVTVFAKARQIYSTQNAHAMAGQYLSNIAALLSNASHIKALSMSDDDLVNPESVAPLLASVRTANEALHGSLQIAQLEIKQGLNRSELDSMSEEELRDELRRLGR